VIVDLHLHTTASDGRCTPHELVKQAAAAGVTAMAVTDHDTIASVEDVRTLAYERGIESISGIEITAVEHGRDVHMLGYFLSPDDPGLRLFLAGQRAVRVTRVKAIAERLAELGMVIDLGAALAEVDRQTGRAIGRPQVARAMIDAGYVATTRDAFDRWLAHDRPAFVPRSGPPPEAVITTIHAAGGLASLAHPGRTSIDDRIPALRDAGLDAIEAYHSDHDASTIARYVRLAGDLDLLMTGGSDYHGDPGHGVTIGASTLPAEAWQRLRDARHRHAAA
jgi:predicted metal-dependent phosphoesterase TrpH